MIGRPRRGDEEKENGEEGAVNEAGCMSGGVRGVGGASTIMIRSFR